MAKANRTTAPGARTPTTGQGYGFNHPGSNMARVATSKAGCRLNTPPDDMLVQGLTLEGYRRWMANHG